MRIAITGATGLLGRNLLFEFIKRNRSSAEPLEAFILGRGQPGHSLARRVEQMIVRDGAAYLALNGAGSPALDDPEAPAGHALREIEAQHNARIHSVEMNLDEERLGIAPRDYDRLQRAPLDFFFHLAGLMDLRDSPQVRPSLWKTNVNGTRHILGLAGALKVLEFAYVGTAFSCGTTGGSIAADYVNFDQPFRNPYEESKLAGEAAVREFARQARVRCRYFRPAVLCGRLIEPALGSTPKFDVFYAVAAFFLRLKLKALGPSTDKYAEPLELDFRMCFDSNSAVNIVPADYAAKVMVEVCTRGDGDLSYHLAHPQATPHALYIPLMLESLNIWGVTAVDCIPDRWNQCEALYYRHTGKIYTPYITGHPMAFDTANLAGLVQQAQLECPAIDRPHFQILMDYAKQHDFGLELAELRGARSNRIQSSRCARPPGSG